MMSPGVVQDMQAFTQAIALEMFDRFGRGAPIVDSLAVLAASDTGFQVGDSYVDPAHFPNLDYRFGDNPSVGARASCRSCGARRRPPGPS